MRIVHLGNDAPGAFTALRQDFTDSNPGYDLSYHGGCERLDPLESTRVGFVQGGAAVASVGEERSDLLIGDLVVLRAGHEFVIDGRLDLVVFDVPTPAPNDVPVFVRPDHDLRITDTPGGCATKGDAYRRVLLTWLDENGPYRWRALNTHRVRMHDSFSHFHPHDGGFDEMYLVQDAPPGARLYTSSKVDRIEQATGVTAAEAVDLVDCTPLTTGDLVWVGRGAMHRAVGGVLAHVITVPGFVPGAEIGLDHHLRALNERLGLSGDAALPFNAEASLGPVVK